MIHEAARAAPQRIALEFQGTTLTFAALAARAGARRRELEHAGAIGARPVALVAEPTLEALVTVLTLIGAHVPVVPLHPRWSERERRAILARTGASLWHASHLLPTDHPPPRWPDDAPPLAILRTSGTSGRPRLALLSHGAFERACRASARRCGWNEDDRWLLALPFAHVGGLSVLLRCTTARRTVVLGPAAPGSPAWERLTLASFVPTQLARLLRLNVAPPPRLRLALVGGGPCTPELARRARAAGWPVRLTYGLTETCAQAATQDGSEPVTDTSCGPPLDGVEVRARDGVLEVRSPSLLTGYWSDGACVPATDGEGWLRTGDLGRLDATGRVHVLGREDEAINSGGEKIAPGPVEAAVARATGATLACAFGVDDPEWGQRVAVAVESNAAFQVLAARLAGGLEELSRYARPRLLAVREELPVGAGGKLSRRQIALVCGPYLRPLDH